MDDAEIEEVYKNGMKGGSSKVEESEPIALRKQSSKSETGNRVWLIPYNKKYYDLKRCYDEVGEVYWTQHFHFKAGDTGYIYGSSPESAIRFSFRIKEADMPYAPKMDQDNKYVKGNGPINEDTEGKLYAHMILTGETTSKRLSLANLLDRGLKGAPMGAMNLSKKELKELIEYINENF